MPRLILMRHAKSDWSFARPDIDRTLNPRGRRSAAALGDWLRRAGYLPDEALCSPAQRTRETFEGLGLDAELRIVDGLYNAGAETILAALRNARGDTVLLLGHNPGIAEAAAQLVATPPEHPRFDDYPTGATLVVDTDAEDWSSLRWGESRVADFTVPRDLEAPKSL